MEDAADYLVHCDTKLGPTSPYYERAESGLRRPGPLPGDDPRRGVDYVGVARPDGPGGAYVDRDATTVRGAANFIRTAGRDRPFCVYLPLGKPHPPYLAEGPFYDAIDPERLPPRIPVPEADAALPPVLAEMRREYRADTLTEDVWRDLRRIYYAMCAKVDALFGEIVSALEGAGLYDDTTILFFSDHGDFAGDYSLPEKAHTTLQDALLRVPLVVKPPAGVPVRPGVRRELVELVDVPATVYDLFGINPGYAVQGVSLLGSLAGRDERPHDAVFAEVGARRGEAAFSNDDVNGLPPDHFYARQARASKPRHVEGSHAVCCRTEDWKYVRRCYTGQHELYDLRADPGETRNLSGRPKVADAERDLETRLLDFLLRTADVLPFERDSRKI
ncbi:MAG: sulfatase-like hydrolase/transferase [Planctomycetota bacterium]